MIRLLLWLLLPAVLAGCASTNLPPVSTGAFTMEEDEKRLWTRSGEEERNLDQSGLLYQNRELEAYLNEVARKLQPPQIYKAIPFEVKIIRNPLLNAFALPNGAIYVHTGLLARMENEAQLATLLAHEMTHATHRHAVRNSRHVRNKTAYLATLRTTIGGTPIVGGVFNTLGEVGAIASVSGYSQDMETEADVEGLKLVVKAGYDPREAPKLFEKLRQDMDEEGGSEPFFFGSHPRLKERARNYERLLKGAYAGLAGTSNAEQFQKKIAPVFLDNAALDLKGGRYGKALRGIEAYLAKKPNDPRGHYMLAEAYRQRSEKGDQAKAISSYQKSLSLDQRHAEAYRGLGLLQYKQGDVPAAKKNLKQYLQLAPQSSDREYVEEYLKQM